MSKVVKNITDNIMDQIHNENIKMRPKMYFIAGSILTFVGLASSVIVSVFFVGLMRFSLRSHGPMASYRLEQILSSFPWWAPFFAIVGLVAGIWLLRKYDFAFKRNFKVLAIGFILAIIAGGWLVDSFGLNDALMRRGPMQGIMRQYLDDSDNERGQGWGKNLRN
jgi:uncharacterized membrane protein YjjP (DUF1212 family)